jgi:hypothetical protein
MNGRLYDPELGRMLSPDPYVQVPEYSQNFNRYSYVLNNPLNLTDPTGFSWFGNLFSLAKWVKENWRTVLVIVVVMVVATLTAGAFIAAAGPLGSAFATASVGATTGSLTMVGGAAVGGITGAVSGGLSAALNGGNLGDVLRGAAISGVQGAIAGGLLHGLDVAAGDATGMAKVGLEAAHKAGHGILGGAANAVMGGKFSDGFYSAALAAELAEYGPFVKTGGSGGVIARTAQASIVGGTVSVIGGGKFANGAYTAAFQHLLNEELEYISNCTLVTPGTLRQMDPNKMNASELVAEAKSDEKLLSRATTVKKLLAGTTTLSKAGIGLGKAAALSAMGTTGNVGKALFSYFVEVPAALGSAFQAAMNKNLSAIDGTEVFPGYLLVEVSTRHQSWITGNYYNSQKYFVVTGPGGSQFNNLQDGLTHFQKEV